MQFSGRVTGLLGTIRTVEQQVRYEYKWSHHLISLLFIANIILWLMWWVMSQSVSQSEARWLEGFPAPCDLHHRQTDRQTATQCDMILGDTVFGWARAGVRFVTFLFIQNVLWCVKISWMNESISNHLPPAVSTSYVYHLSSTSTSQLHY